MKQLAAIFAPILICSQLIASETTTLDSIVRLEAQNWAQKVASLENKEEQQALAELVHLSIKVTETDKSFRTFIAGFINMAQTICQNGLQLKKQTHTIMNVTKLSIALLKTSETYRTIFNKWKTLTKLFEQKNNFSDDSINLYNLLNKNIQKNIIDFFENKKKTTNILVEKYNQLLAVTPQKMTTDLQNIYSHLDNVVDSIEENQQTLFKINMTSLAADIVWKESFIGIQTALKANKPKEIVQQASLIIFQTYFDELKNNIEIDTKKLD